MVESIRRWRFSEVGREHFSGNRQRRLSLNSPLTAPSPVYPHFKLRKDISAITQLPFGWKGKKENKNIQNNILLLSRPLDSLAVLTRNDLDPLRTHKLVRLHLERRALDDECPHVVA